MSKKTLYMVMRLNHNVRITMPNGDQDVVEIGGIYGFIPVYETENDAKKETHDGLFQIIEIEVPDNESMG